MSNLYILSENGEPVRAESVTQWGEWFESADRIVAQYELAGVLVSTVFLGSDHSFGSGPPVLWETMIFGGEHDEYQERYTSRESAIEGHGRACDLVRILP